MTALAQGLGALIARLRPGGGQSGGEQSGPEADAPAANPNDADADPVEREAYAKLLAGAEAARARDWPCAAESFQAAFVAYRRCGDSRSAALAQQIVSLVLDHIAEPVKARAAYAAARRALAQAGLLVKEALALAGRAGDASCAIETRLFAARLEQARGKSAEARAHLTAARKTAESAKDPDLIEQVTREGRAVMQG